MKGIVSNGDGSDPFHFFHFLMRMNHLWKVTFFNIVHEKKNFGNVIDEDHLRVLAPPVSSPFMLDHSLVEKHLLKDDSLLIRPYRGPLSKLAPLALMKGIFVHHVNFALSSLGHVFLVSTLYLP